MNTLDGLKQCKASYQASRQLFSQDNNQDVTNSFGMDRHFLFRCSIAFCLLLLAPELPEYLLRESRKTQSSLQGDLSSSLQVFFFCTF